MQWYHFGLKRTSDAASKNFCGFGRIGHHISSCGDSTINIEQSREVVEQRWIDCTCTWICQRHGVIVESYTSTKPHYVSIAKNGKVTCQDCPNWKALKICAHAIAAAEKSGILPKYIKWIRDKGPAHINITVLMTSDSSNGTGKKGGKAFTARRKGGKTTKRSPVTTVVDRPAFIPTPAASQPSQRVRTEAQVHAPRPV